MFTVRLPMVLATIALALLACGGAGTPPTSQPSPTDGTDSTGGDGVTISANNLTFDTNELRIPADEAFQLTLVNQEAAPHNVAIYQDSSRATALFTGQIISSAEKTEQVPAIPAGEYYFQCDVHPDINGTAIAE